MIDLEIQCIINEESLLETLGRLSPEEQAAFAIRLGEEGDVTYELLLLNKIIDVLSTIYPPDDKDDVEMTTLVRFLLSLKPIINNMI